jgi:hypothetical protein
VMFYSAKVLFLPAVQKEKACRNNKLQAKLLTPYF